MKGCFSWNGCKLDGFQKITLAKLGNTAVCSEVPNRLDIVNLVAAATGDLYRTNTFEFTGHVASCLAKIDSNWGRRINRTGPVSNDVVAYRLNGSDSAPCGVDIVTGARGDNPRLSWQQATSYTEVVGKLQAAVVLLVHCLAVQSNLGRWFSYHRWRMYTFMCSLRFLWSG